MWQSERREDWIVTCSKDATAIVTDAKTGEEIIRLQGHGKGRQRRVRQSGRQSESSPDRTAGQ